MADVVGRARADLAAGRAWKARDRLTGALPQRSDDDQLIDLLAQTHYATGDLPAAGALWFITGRNDPAATEALAAWRERAGNAEAQWSSLPRPLRAPPLRPHLADLHTAASQVRADRLAAHRAQMRSGADNTDRLQLGEYAGCVFAIAVPALVLVLTVIGGVTVVTWLF